MANTRKKTEGRQAETAPEFEEVRSEDLRPGDSIIVYGTRTATVVANDGTGDAGVTIDLDGRERRGLFPGKKGELQLRVAGPKRRRARGR